MDIFWVEMDVQMTLTLSSLQSEYCDQMTVKLPQIIYPH